MRPNRNARNFGNAPRYPRYTSPGIGGGGCIVILVLLFIIGGICFEVLALTHKQNVTFTVNDKMAKTDCSHDNGCKSKYLIYTDHGVYQDTDSLIYLKFNSSDLYGKLKRFHTYDCKVYGFRIPLLSHYKNLVSCDEVNSG